MFSLETMLWFTGLALATGALWGWAICKWWHLRP